MGAEYVACIEYGELCVRGGGHTYMGKLMFMLVLTGLFDAVFDGFDFEFVVFSSE